MKSIALFALFIVNLATCIAANSPFKDAKLYVNPSYKKKVEGTIAKLDKKANDYEKTLNNLKIASDTSTSIWLNSAKDVQTNNTSLNSMNGILVDASKKKDTMVVFVLNNIPTGQCAKLLEPYKTSFINNIVALATKYRSTPMAFIVEPNAVGWMTTDSPRCEDTPTQKRVWKEAVSFAITELKKCRPDTPIYLGLGHSRWLGNEKNSAGAAEVVKSWGVVNDIRGFATNIGNYQPVGKACPKALFCADKNNAAKNSCCIESCALTRVFNDNNEMNYALRMESFFQGKKFVIDTGRNGVSNARTNCSFWCNIRNTGLGLRPSGKTESPLVDAYLWIKPPGETSGCTEILPSGQKCTSFNGNCTSPDSIGTRQGEPRMPEAGQYSDFFMSMLARNANFKNEQFPFAPATETPHVTFELGTPIYTTTVPPASSTPPVDYPITTTPAPPAGHTPPVDYPITTTPAPPASHTPPVEYPITTSNNPEPTNY